MKGIHSLIAVILLTPNAQCQCCRRCPIIHTVQGQNPESTQHSDSFFGWLLSLQSFVVNNFNDVVQNQAIDAG